MKQQRVSDGKEALEFCLKRKPLFFCYALIPAILEQKGVSPAEHLCRTNEAPC